MVLLHETVLPGVAPVAMQHGATPPASCATGSEAATRRRSATTTRATWRPSAARLPSRRSRLDTLLAQGARGRDVQMVSRAPAASVLAAAETRSPRKLGAA